MEIATLVSVLDHPHLAAHLQSWGLVDVDRGRETLIQLADLGLTLDLLAGEGAGLPTGSRWVGGACALVGEQAGRTPYPVANWA